MSFRGRRPRSSSVSLPYPSVLTKRIRTHATRTHTHIHHAFFAFRWMAARAVVYLAARAVLYPVCLRSLPRMRAPRLDKHGPGMHASERGALVRLSLIILFLSVVRFSPAHAQLSLSTFRPRHWWRGWQARRAALGQGCFRSCSQDATAYFATASQSLPPIYMETPSQVHVLAQGARGEGQRAGGRVST